MQGMDDASAKGHPQESLHNLEARNISTGVGKSLDRQGRKAWSAGYQFYLQLNCIELRVPRMSGASCR